MRWPISAKLVLALLLAVAIASLFANYRFVMQERQRPVMLEPEELLSLTKSEFPAEYASPSNPENLLLIFILDSSKTLQHKVASQKRENEDILATMRGALPGLELGARPSAGTMCFVPEPGKHGQFCAAWAVPGGKS